MCTVLNLQYFFTKYLLLGGLTIKGKSKIIQLGESDIETFFLKPQARKKLLNQDQECFKSKSLVSPMTLNEIHLLIEKHQKEKH